MVPTRTPAFLLPMTRSVYLIAALSNASVVGGSSVDGLVGVHVTIPYFEIKPALGVGADPGFVVDRSSLAAKI